MGGRQSLGILIGMLLAVGAGGLVWVVVALSSQGRPFAEEPAPQPRTAPEWKRAEAEVAPEIREPLPSGEAPTVEEPAPAADEEEAESETVEPPLEDPPYEPARLTLELIDVPELPEPTIHVSVHDTQGNPIPRAMVVFRTGATIAYRDRSDSQGKVEFEPYPGEMGPFRVDAIAEGYVTASFEAAKPGAEVDLILKLRPYIEGEVLSPSKGEGIVRLFTEGGERSVPVREDNTFLLTDLDEGFVTVQAEVEPHGTDSVSFYLEGDVPRYVKLRIRKRARVHIFGMLHFWPGKGSVLINGHPQAIHASGRFEYERAVLGVNEILVDAPGRALMKERFTVVAGRSMKFEFRLRNAARIKGRVVGEPDRPHQVPKAVPNALVRIGVEFDDPRNDRVQLFPVERVPIVRTDREGRFEIDRLDLRLGYVISVVAQGYGQALVRIPASIGRHRIVLPQGPFLFGRVSGLGGLPKGAEITALRLEENPSSRVFNVENYDGSNAIRQRDSFYGLSGMLPGIYQVRVSHADFGSVETIIDLLDGRRQRLDLRLRRGGQVADGEVELLRRLPPAVYTEEDDEALAPGYTTLQVDARQPESKEPFPGVEVRFFEGDLEFLPPMSFSELEFKLYGLPEANYRAVLTHPSLRKPLVRSDVQLRAGEGFTLAFGEK